MNINKNTLIAICVIAIGGIVLYQVLFNFIFPIALLLFLLYVLKLLIKGENNEEIKDYQFVDANPNSVPTENVVSIESEEEVNSAEESNMSEEVNSAEESNMDEVVNSAEESNMDEGVREKEEN